MNQRVVASCPRLTNPLSAPSRLNEGRELQRVGSAELEEDFKTLMPTLQTNAGVCLNKLAQEAQEHIRSARSETLFQSKFGDDVLPLSHPEDNAVVLEFWTDRRREWLQECVAVCRSALALNPSNPKTHVQLAQALSNQNFLSQSLDAYEVCRDMILRGTSDGERKEILSLIESGKLQGARERLETTRGQESQDPAAALRLVQTKIRHLRHRLQESNRRQREKFRSLAESAVLARTPGDEGDVGKVEPPEDPLTEFQGAIRDTVWTGVIHIQWVISRVWDFVTSSCRRPSSPAPSPDRPRDEPSLPRHTTNTG